MTPSPKVAIIYLSFHSEPYMDDVISSLQKMTYLKDQVEFIVVDNPHPEHGSSMRYLEDTVMPLSGVSIPHVTLLPQKTNIGFAGGNNVGIQWAIDHGFDYVYFHNNDGFMAANCLELLVKAMEADQSIGVAQSLLLLHPETELINTAGNSFHYLGFGYCGNFRMKRSDLQAAPIEEISYASGASLLMRSSLLKQYGLWHSELFLYHEDLEYSLRMRMTGYKPVMVKDAIFYHKYAFGRTKTKFYYMERNRYAVMLMYFKLPTLLLLLPIGIVMELGLLVFSALGGWFGSKLKVYGYWLKPSTWKLWLGKRQQIQRMRKVKDKVLMAKAVSVVAFDEHSMKNPLLRYIGNPIMTAYWFIIKRLIFW